MFRTVPNTCEELIQLIQLTRVMYTQLHNKVSSYHGENKDKDKDKNKEKDKDKDKSKKKDKDKDKNTDRDKEKEKGMDKENC